MAGPPEDRQCTAKSRTTGNRCKAWAMPGQAVCYYHGGSSPQAKKKAQLRLDALAQPAIAALQRVMEQAEADSDVLAAANSILDRAGYSRTHNITSDDAREILLARLLEAHAEHHELEE